MRITNALVYTELGTFEKKDIFIENEFFTSNTEQPSSLDAEGLIAIPGLTDLHFHGCMGYDFCDGTKKALQEIANYEASNGITTICPATMTLPKEQLVKICETTRNVDMEMGAELVGIHMEGPFISNKKKGAQNGSYIKNPEPALYRELQEKSGNRIKIVDLAPELEGAMEFIDMVKQEVIVSLAHTDADYETAMEAFKHGASQVTHLYNAMPPYHHRAPGVIGAAADCQTCSVELICDGIHVHPSVIRSTFSMFGKECILLISDSMMATGMQNGEYTLGGQKVYVTGNKATLEDGTVAGSVSNLFDCVRYCVHEVGIALEDAIWCAAVTPAKKLGIYDSYGSITPGKVANLVLVDEKLKIRKVIVRGREI